MAQAGGCEAGPLFLGAVLRVSDDRTLLFHRVHHIALDGAGMALFAERVAEVYSHLSEGSQVPPSGWSGLRTLVDAEKAYRGSAEHDADGDRWRGRLAGRSHFPALGAGPAAASDRSLRTSRGVPVAEFTELRDGARRLGHRWTRLFTAATAILSHAMTGDRDVVLSLPVAGRSAELVRSVPAMTANVLPLRLRVDPAASVGRLLDEVAEELRAVRRHQRYRGERLRREMDCPDDGRRFFGPVLNIQRFDRPLRFGSLTATVRNLQAPPSEDLSFFAHDRGDGQLRLDFDANPANHGEDLLAGVADRLPHVLRQVARAERDTPLARIATTTTGERRRLAALGTGAPTPAAPAETAVDRFADRVRRAPDAFAVRCAGTGERLTYRELDRRTAALAGALARRRRGTGTHRRPAAGAFGGPGRRRRGGGAGGRGVPAPVPGRRLAPAADHPVRRGHAAAGHRPAHPGRRRREVRPRPRSAPAGRASRLRRGRRWRAARGRGVTGLPRLRDVHLRFHRPAQRGRHQPGRPGLARRRPLVVRGRRGKGPAALAARLRRVQPGAVGAAPDRRGGGRRRAGTPRPGRTGPGPWRRPG
ncbi:Dimodular nonribosomal peptide synthase [Streptomyces malaysiensis subsp. malaysiensis]|nr:Dimodular nonribosomal peptide synthase [Streptomyces sp. M56]